MTLTRSVVAAPGDARRRHLKISALALVGAVAMGLVLAAVGATGLAPAISSSLLMGATVAAVTFVILERVAPAARFVEVPPPAEPQVVSSAIACLGEHDDAMRAAAAAWDSRPDPFAVGWEEASVDPDTDEHELRAWEDWTRTLSAESAAAPVWADEPRSLSFDFKRWLAGSPDQDTLELPVVTAESTAPTGVELPSVPEPATHLEQLPDVPAPAGPRPQGPGWQSQAPSTSQLDLTFPPLATQYPNFSPWPDAPWRPALPAPTQSAPLPRPSNDFYDRILSELRVVDLAPDHAVTPGEQHVDA